MTAPPQIERLADWPDPIALHAFAPERYPFLLESAARGTRHARWDVLFALPGERIELDADGVLVHGDGDGFLDALDRAWSAERSGRVDSPLPFTGGWFVHCGYELAAEVEPRLEPPRRSGDDLPTALAVRCRGAILRDHDRHEAWIAVEDGRDAGEIHADLAAVPALNETFGPLTAGAPEEDPDRPYLDAVERARRYIHDGDVFQANLSRAWRGRLRKGITPVDCYLRLRRRNPAPFSGLMRIDDSVTVVSSSPERLVRVDGDRVETRPIAGTRPRGAGTAHDSALAVELLAHPKERAEHVMLIDLERNDLGRICRPGSIAVDEMMVVESYATVHHIVSNVSGRLREDVTPGAVIRAVFPGGTITGCPKVRCMEIIAELERTPRGAYTGSFGWLGRSGDMDLNILIRTMTVRGHDFELRAGAGIVADSDPRRELEETRAKAAGLLHALAADS